MRQSCMWVERVSTFHMQETRFSSRGELGARDGHAAINFKRHARDTPRIV